ncbi:MAG: hypothetical protein WDZ69_01770 [Candidatus Pacearchaeota archaeon]
MEQKINLEVIYNKLEKLESFMKRFEQFAEDLEFARRTEEARERIENGEGIRMDFDEFIEEAEKW